MKKRVFTAMIAFSALAVAGYSGSAAANSTITGAVANDYGVQVDPELAEMVPDSVKARGIVLVGDPGNPPSQFVNDKGEVGGYTPDIVLAVAQKLGVNLNYERASFDTVIPGIQAGRYDTNPINDTEERRKVLDFVNFMTRGTSLLTLEGNPGGLDIENLCDREVGALNGSGQMTLADQLSKDCVAAGKPELRYSNFGTLADLQLAVRSKRIEAALFDSNTAGYVVHISPGFDAPGKVIGAAMVGFPFKKESGLTKPFALALQSLLEDGTIDKIRGQWGEDAIAPLPAILINGQPIP